MNETLVIIIRMFADVSLGAVLMLAIFCQYEQIRIVSRIAVFFGIVSIIAKLLNI